jgi:hypothetical protein
MVDMLGGQVFSGFMQSHGSDNTILTQLIDEIDPFGIRIELRMNLGDGFDHAAC